MAEERLASPSRLLNLPLFEKGTFLISHDSDPFKLLEDAETVAGHIHDLGELLCAADLLDATGTDGPQYHAAIGFAIDALSCIIRDSISAASISLQIKVETGER